MVSITIVGDPGAGKTATLAYMGLMYYKQGYTLHSNFQLYLPQPDGEKRSISHLIKTYNDFNKIREGYFLGDELWSWIDARMSMSDANMFLSDILLKARKRHFNLINTTQHISQLEKRIRNITQYVIYPVQIITDPETGDRIEIKHDLLHPVNMRPYLPHTHIHAFVCVADPLTGFYDKVVSEFEFPLEPIANVYNTDEEVEMLLSGELEQGIKVERQFCKVLREAYPDEDKVEINLMPASGINQETLDVEMFKDSVLHIYDVTSLMKSKKYFYLNFHDKDLSKYPELEKSRGAKTYFAFKYEHKWYQLPSHHVWNVTKQTVPIAKLLPFCEEIVPATTIV